MFKYEIFSKFSFIKIIDWYFCCFECNRNHFTRKPTNKQTDRHANKQTNTNRQIGKHNCQTDDKMNNKYAITFSSRVRFCCCCCCSNAFPWNWMKTKHQLKISLANGKQHRCWTLDVGWCAGHRVDNQSIDRWTARPTDHITKKEK